MTNPAVGMVATGKVSSDPFGFGKLGITVTLEDGSTDFYNLEGSYYDLMGKTVEFVIFNKTTAKFTPEQLAKARSKR